MRASVYSLFVFSALLVFVSCSNNVNTDSVSETKDNVVKTPLIETQIGKSGYFISIPANYTIVESEGPDFYVYYIQTADSTDTVSFSAGMYFGNHPGKFGPANDSCIADVIDGNILESNAEWTVYNCKGAYSVQAIADSKSGEGWNSLVHAFGNGSSESDVHEVVDIFATLRKKQ